MGTLKVAQILHESYTDGPGRRAVLFVNGCPVMCPGCQSPHLWGLDGGTEMKVDDVAAELLDTGLPVTISGGEPFAQAEGVAELLVVLRVQRPDLHIIVYSGFVLEDILEMSEAIPEMKVILDFASVLVDGPFVPELDHDFVQWRGSSNQRPIDLDRAFHVLRNGNVGIEVPLPILNWDEQTITITAGGDLVATAGMMDTLFDGEALEHSRMCGQTR